MTISKNANIRVFIVEDHPAVHQGLSLLLGNEGISVCGQAEDAASAMTAIPQAKPTVVMTDLSLGETESGMNLISALKAKYPSLPILVYSMHEEGELVEQALAFGAKGYVSKRDITDVLITALVKVIDRDIYISPRAARSLTAQSKELIQNPGNLTPKPLSKQERKVYTMLGQGLSAQDIADKLEVSPRTVESYYSRILVKLDLYSVKDLRRHAILAEKI